MRALALLIYDQSMVTANRVHLNKHSPIIRFLTKDLQLWDRFIQTNPKISFNNILCCQNKFVEAFSDASDT